MYYQVHKFINLKHYTIYINSLSLVSVEYRTTIYREIDIGGNMKGVLVVILTVVCSLQAVEIGE